MRFVPRVPKIIIQDLGRSRIAPVVILIVVLCAAEYGFRYYFSVPAIIGYLTYWLGLSFFFYVVTKNLVVREHDDMLLFVTIGMTGAVTGLFLALWKVYLYQELWTAFNLIAEPVRTGLYGFMIAWLFVRAQSNVRQATFSSPN
ncbi:MAG: hypothetical protein WC052_00225 [Patescibacteria group bacterium]